MNEQLAKLVEAVISFLISTDAFKKAIEAEVRTANASQIIANQLGQRVTKLEEQVQGRTREASPDDLEDRIDDLEERISGLDAYDFDEMQSSCETAVRDLSDHEDELYDIIVESHRFEDAVKSVVGELDTSEIVDRLERLESKLSDIGSILS